MIAHSITILLGLVIGQGLLVEELPTPVLWWEHGNPLCSQVRAVDASGMLWHDEGCENGRFTFEPLEQLSEEELESLTRFFATLPTPPPAVSCSGGLAHRFVRRDEAAETYWTACGTSNVQGEIDGLDRRFLEAARIFRGLEGANLEP